MEARRDRTSPALNVIDSSVGKISISLLFIIIAPIDGNLTLRTLLPRPAALAASRPLTSRAKR
jgi:hypothetical protein